MARRAGRISNEEHERAVAFLGVANQELDQIEVTASLTTRAGTFADYYALHGYDAVHLAAVESIEGPDTLIATGDGELAEAARSLNIAVASLN